MSNSEENTFFKLNNFDKTDNGASSYSIGSHDPRVVLFIKSIRGMELKDPSKPDDTEKFLEFLLKLSWNESPLDTLKLIFYIRDCRQGKGEKLIFRSSCRWLLEYHSSELKRNLKHIPFYGTWKDPLQIFGGTVFEKKVIKIHTRQLKTDLEKLKFRDDDGLNCVLDLGAAKFAPSEGCEFDKRWRLATKFASALNVNKAIYRKKYLRPLRSAGVKIVEEQMCEKDWENINFSTVPSIAGKKYKDTFKKHCPEKYESFIENVIKGEVKMNVSVLTPVDILKDYTSGYGFSSSIERNPVIEAQWYQMISDQRKRRNILSLESGLPSTNTLCVVDVSGSMFSKMGNGFSPIQVSLGLGLTISLLNDEKSPFFRKWITFSGNPKMETLKGNQLHEMINNMDQKNWSQNTNFESVFDLILETATAFSVPQANMPSMLIVISDMQFDDVESEKTNWKSIETKYEETGYVRPTLVFWNASSKTMDMPIPHSDVPNCALISGFSTNLLDPLIDGVVPSPFFLMRKVIDSSRYERISYPTS
jgi:hypothetical protein